MHHSPTKGEADFQQRRRQEWLRDLADQVNEREHKRQMERKEKELEEMKDEVQGVTRVRSKDERHRIHASDSRWGVKGTASYT